MTSTRQCEIILYNELYPHEQFKKSIKQICDSYKTIKQYAFILHDKDDKKPHYHLLLKFNSPVHVNNLISWFGINNNQIGKIKSNFVNALQYLTHSNALDKYQYDITEITSNFDIQEYIITEQNKLNALDNIQKYSNNEISFYEMWSSLSASDKMKYDKSITTANKVRMINISLKGNRDMKVYYVYGNTGSGKTTFAKWFSDKVAKKPYFVSGSSNDPLDGYLGQPIIILDDLRDDSFKFHDLLKFLDNHTNSSVKSRYYNKNIDCEILIITSTKLLSEMYLGKTDEDLLQLYRRVNEVLTINPDKSITSRKIDIKQTSQFKKLVYDKDTLTLPNNINEIYESLEIIRDNTPSIVDIIQQAMKKG